MDKDFIKYLLLLAIILPSLGGIGYWIIQEMKECHDSGGAFVRGIIGFECVAGVKK